MSVGVTPIDRPTSRNEWDAITHRLTCRNGVFWNARCTRCGVRVDVLSDGMTDEGTPSGRLRPAAPHCCTCRTHGDHNSCLTCGKCLSRWIPFGSRFYGGARLDKRYCSDACRQRAYRKRRAAS
jgi:hypothetical protein